MAEPPEFWLFVASNFTSLVLGVVLTAVSATAARRSGQDAFRVAAVGFGLITAGSIVEGVYELGIRDSFVLPGDELLVLRTVEGLLITVGMAALYLSIRRY